MNPPTIARIGTVAAAAIGIAVLSATAGSAAVAKVDSLTPKVASITSSTQGKIPANEFVDVVPGVPSSLAPGSFDTPTFTLLPNWYSTLVSPKAAPIGSGRVPGVADVLPNLATSWKVAGNGSITYTLRKGVKSANGDELTAADVKYSIDRIIKVDPADEAQLLAININLKDPVTVHGQYSVTINQTAPSALSVDAMTWYGVGIFDAKQMLAHATKKDPWSTKWLSSHSASFGPYEVTSFQPSQEITLKANPYYFKQPYFKTVVIKAVTDPSARLELVLNGQASHTQGLTWQQFKNAQTQAKAKHLVAQPVQTGALEYLFLDERDAPLANQDVREAINYAINKQQLSSGVFLGYEKPALYQIPSTLHASFKPIPEKYNIAKAKQLLAAGGYPNGFTLQIAGSPGETSAAVTDEMALLQSELGAIGITVTIDNVTSTSAYITGEGSGAYQASIDDVNSTPAEPGYFLNLSWSSTNPYSSASGSKFSDPALQSILAQLPTLPLGSKYDSLVSQAYNLVNAAVPAVPLVEPDTQNVGDGSIKGWGAYPNPIVYYANLHR
jgi:peptide/nickel transport system substrate-binding protein